MSEGYVLKAEARERAGKGAARAIRRNGMIPAVIYGDKKEPLSITLPYKETSLKVYGGGFLTTVADIEVDGKKHRVLPKSYDLDPVRDFIMHVDFLRVSEKTKVTVNIPVHFTNEEESPGLEEGGVLNVVRHEVEVHVPAGNIPDYFEADLTGVELGDAIKISAVKLPSDVELTITDRDFTLATIAAPAALKSDEEEAEEAAADEVEVIGEGEEGEAEGEASDANGENAEGNEE